MFETKDLQRITADELQEELVRAIEYTDKLIGLGYTLMAVHSGVTALGGMYATQKGHEVFLMALNVVEQATEHRGKAVASRTATMMQYTQQIAALLGQDLPEIEDWPSYEVLADLEGKI